MVLFLVSGLLLWFGEQDTRFRFASTVILHDGLLYASLALLLGHLYLALIHPTTRHALRGMVLGNVREDWAREHHARWKPASNPNESGRLESRPLLFRWRELRYFAAAGWLPSVSVRCFVLPPRRTVSVTLSPTLDCVTEAVSASALRIDLPVVRGDHVALLEPGLRRRRARDDLADLRAATRARRRSARPCRRAARCRRR